MSITSRILFSFGLLWVVFFAVPANHGESKPNLPENPSPGVPVSHVSYLYIESNEEGAAGGHVALRVDNTVYHYQRLAAGPFVMDRMPFSAFLFTYSHLQNRNVHELVLPPLQRSAADALEHRLNLRYLEHRRMVVGLDRQRLRLRMLTDLKEKGMAVVSVPAAGYFLPGGGPDGSLDDLRGPFDAGEALHEYSSDAAMESLQEGILESLVLNGKTEAPGAFAVSDVPFRHGPPGDGERDRSDLVHGILAAWHRRMAAIVRSDRRIHPDRGRTVLEMLVLAHALEGSARRSLLTVPVMAVTDGQPVALGQPRGAGSPDTATIAGGSDVAHDADGGLQYYGQIVRRRLDGFWTLAARRVADDRSCDDACAAALLSDWNALLRLAARYELARRYGSTAILDHGFITDTPALARDVLVQVRDAADLEREWTEALARERMLSEKVDRNLDYSLLGKNCVTELMKDMEPTIGKVGSPATGAALPWMSLQHMRKRFPSAEVILHLSYRNELLRGNGASAEGLTLTSRHYQFNERDSLFLFFSEDAGWLRPLVGLANLLPATGQTAAGVAVLPVTGPSLLRRGLRGLLFSGAEVAGLSIRKGTFRSSQKEFYKLPTAIAENGGDHP